MSPRFYSESGGTAASTFNYGRDTVDNGPKNYYPMMRVTVRQKGTIKATNDIVLPVSDEMDCKLCHASGSPSGARPAKGWAFHNAPEKDYKLNVLRLHDERRDPARWPALLVKAGYDAAGLEATALGGRPVLCGKCHLSNAVPGTGIGTIKPLTAAIHAKHAQVLDPFNRNLPLDSVDNRSACYRCHPGSETKCLRGAMGNAGMQCQNCHGSMSVVGASTRKGWLDEPGCQTCHTGTATQNTGQIRYTDAFVAPGVWRQPAAKTFATQPDTLYRMSRGHGGLQCEACHGATHAEYPSSHANDNVMAINLQGHAGTLVECMACHKENPKTVTGGPHGMHPVGQFWVSGHEDAVENRGAELCQACHGADYRGTVLSAALANRSFNTEWGPRSFAKGTRIGCYNCHNGPRGK